MSRFEDPVIISCSISGAIANRDQCPAIPYTPQEYAAEARRIVDAYDVRHASLDQPIRMLSGGNIQKFILGRELGQAPSVVIANQPTWGLDIGAVMPAEIAVSIVAELVLAMRGGPVRSRVSDASNASNAPEWGVPR